MKDNRKNNILHIIIWINLRYILGTIWLYMNNPHLLFYK